MEKKVDWTKPIRKINGEAARFMGRVDNIQYPVVVVTGSPGYETPVTYSEDGAYRLSPGPEISSLDIENIPEERFMYVNLYPSKGLLLGVAHSSREQADAEAGSCRVSCQKVLIEPGRFDD